MKKRYNSGSQAHKAVVRDTMGLIYLYQFYQYNFIGSSEKAPHLQHGNKDHYQAECVAEQHTTVNSSHILNEERIKNTKNLSSAHDTNGI